MHGEEIPFYCLCTGKVDYYPFLMHESDIARKMEDLLFKDLGLRKEDKFYIEYGTSKDCYFDMTIEDRVESQGDCNDFEI